MIVVWIFVGLGMFLAVACIKDARRGRRQWATGGQHDLPPTTASAAKAAKAGIATTIGLGVFFGVGGDG